MKPDLAARLKRENGFLAGGGEMGARIREFDWSRTALGPVESWPQSLRSAVSILLPSKAQIALFWGRDLITLYNDAYRPVFGAKHPVALGLPIRESWSELWGAGLKDLFEGVLATGEAYSASDRPFFMVRFGYLEETFFDVSYDPVRDESGQVGGVFCIVSETTARVVGERRLKTLRDLSAREAGEPKSVDETCQGAVRVLEDNPYDIPFALIYLLNRESTNARPAGVVGLPNASVAVPPHIDVTGSDRAGAAWPLEVVFKSRHIEIVTGLQERFGMLPSSVWPEPPHTAVVLPVGNTGQHGLTGFLVIGISPRRPLDDQYHVFLTLLASQMATRIAHARAFEEERKRAEALAELDRAKTVFFSNVSHEFRTPLTLMLGPLEQLLYGGQTDLSPATKGELEVVNRNGLRLLRLVNGLLDFSRIEAGRAQASFAPTDLSTLTEDLASCFRSATERAGIRLIVTCPPLPEPVYVDRDMWEKIVLNLLSNAFKFTFDGEIEVTLRQAGSTAELRVRDTGTGIPVEALPRLFERFYRVEQVRGRTFEGSGIGLALVQELIKLHGGTVEVESQAGTGSTFIVRVPFGTAHLPSDRIDGGRTVACTATGAAPFIEEALRWLPDQETDQPIDGNRDVPATGLHSSHNEERASATAGLLQDRSEGGRPHVLVADDNADMRDYVGRILSAQFSVHAVPDGEAALASAKRHRPDVVLTDVMMPRLDGFGVLRAFREDPDLRSIPVIMLSARAGEEARVEGFESGADDYLIKPFSARELSARVTAYVTLARARRQAQEELSRSKWFIERIAASTPDCLFVYDFVAGKNIYMNRNVYSMVGYTVEQLQHMPGDLADTLIHPDDLAPLRTWFARFDMAGSEEVLEHETRVRRADDSYAWLSLRASRFEKASDGSARQIIGVASDITERKRANVTIDTQKTSLEMLVSGAPLTDVLTYLARVVERQSDGQSISSILLLDERGCLRNGASPSLPDEYLKAIDGLQARPGIGTCCAAAATGQVVTTPDLDADAGWPMIKHFPLGLGLVAAWSQPILSSEGRVLGTFGTYLRQKREPSPAERQLVQMLAQTAALAIQRTHAEDAIRYGEKRLRDLNLVLERRVEEWQTLFNLVPAGILVAHDQDCRVITGNEHGAALLRGKVGDNLSKSGPTGDRLPFRVYSGTRELRPEELPMQYAAARGVEVRHQEVDVVYHDGEHRTLKVSAAPLFDGNNRVRGCVGVFADVTEDKTAERALREREEQLRAMFGQAAVGIAIIDRAGRLCEFNQHLCNIIGRRRDELSNLTWAVLAHPEDWTDTQRLVDSVLAGSRPSFDIENRYEKPDGSWVWVNLSVAPLRNEIGEITRLMAVIQDVTGRKAAEMQLRSLAAELEDRVEARTDELVRSQERLRALATELNLTEHRERRRIADELHDYLAQMLVLGRLKLGQAKRLEGLAPKCIELLAQTEDVLSESLLYTRTLVADLSPPVLREFGLPAALKWLGERMSRQDLQVTVQVAWQDSLRLPEDRAVLLFQSVRELLLNAVKHARAEQVGVQVRAESSELHIEVSDDGVGFNPVAMSMRTESITAESSKFGLFSIRERMKALGGQFAITSADGQGTRATLILPLDAQAVTRPEPVIERPANNHSTTAQPLPSLASARIRVLLVDDHAMVRQGLRSVLESYPDVEVVGETWNGQEAVAQVERLRPSLVVMDINMPQMNGIEATVQIKARYPDTIVIGLSVQADGANEEAIIRAGAVALLTKEAAVDDLYRTIQMMKVCPVKSLGG